MAFRHVPIGDNPESKTPTCQFEGPSLSARVAITTDLAPAQPGAAFNCSKTSSWRASWEIVRIAIAQCPAHPVANVELQPPKRQRGPRRTDSFPRQTLADLLRRSLAQTLVSS